MKPHLSDGKVKSRAMPGFLIGQKCHLARQAPIGLILPDSAESVTYRNAGIVPSRP